MRTMGGNSNPIRRVALVHDWLNGMRGGEKVFEIFCEMFPKATVFTLFYEPDQISDAIRRMKVVESPLARLPGARKRYRWLLPILPLAVERFPTQDFDLVISTSHCVAKAARPPRRGLHLCYCFTPMRYIWDQFDQYFPSGPGPAEWGGFVKSEDWSALKRSASEWSKRMAMSLARGPLQRWDRRAADRVDAFFADSRNVAKKIRRYYGRNSKVVYPPADTEFFTPDGASPRNDAPFLVVSALVPYKRIDRAIEAANALRRRLVVVGDGPERKRLEALAGPTVEFLGWVDNDTLRDCYRGCRALLYPGEEDFGITAVEAQACGRPVIALGRGGALETVDGGTLGAVEAGTRGAVEGGRTGLFFGKASAEGLAAAMKVFDSMRFSPADCRARAERFSRDGFRQRMESEIIERVERLL